MCVGKYCMLSLCVKLLYVKFVCVKLLYVKDKVACVREACVREACVREACVREAAGGGGTRDTESKTRTPHKVVGNYSCDRHLDRSLRSGGRRRKRRDNI